MFVYIYIYIERERESATRNDFDALPPGLGGDGRALLDRDLLMDRASGLFKWTILF